MDQQSIHTSSSASPFGDPDSESMSSAIKQSTDKQQQQQQPAEDPIRDLSTSNSPPLVDLLENPFQVQSESQSQVQGDTRTFTNDTFHRQQEEDQQEDPLQSQIGFNRSSSSINPTITHPPKNQQPSSSNPRSRSTSRSRSSTESLQRELDALEDENDEEEDQGDEEDDGLISSRNSGRDRKSRSRNGKSAFSNGNLRSNRRETISRMGQSSMLNSVTNLGGNAFKSLTSIGKKISKAAQKEREELELSRSRIDERNGRFRNQEEDDEDAEEEEEEEEGERDEVSSSDSNLTDIENQGLDNQDSKAGGSLNRTPVKETSTTKKKEKKRSKDQSKRRDFGKLDEKERALWEWANVEDLDEFLREAYDYYTGKGIFCILLSKFLNLLTIGFVIFFSTFLVGCIDYSEIKHDGNLKEVLVESCFNRFSTLTLLFFVILLSAYAYQVLRFSLGIKRLFVMKRFFTHLLEVPDADVQSIPWNTIISKLSTLVETVPLPSQIVSSSSSNQNQNSQRLDAHEVANRIMRRENYLIALFNKDVLDLSLPVPSLLGKLPFVGDLLNGDQGKMLSKSLEWNIEAALIGFLFDENGRVRNRIVREKYRGDLIDGLKRRFILLAIFNAIFAPFIVLYLLIFSFFRYFEEYHKDPSNLGSRQYTSFAKWKFREFNELPHIFKRRCHHSYPYAKRYIDQFPKEKVAILARFVSFIAGSFTAVLILASVIDPDLFLHFDITSQRNVLFYIGIFGAILATSRGMIPTDEHINFEPETLLRAIIRHTHFMPIHWKGRLHSTEVHQEFGRLYTLKVGIFFMEILGVFITPFILWISLPKSSPAIIDFFREFTVHVDSLGYVCSFAVFNFERNGNVKFGAPTGGRILDERFSSKEGKMEQSFMGFKAANPDWLPNDPSGSLFLSRIIDGGVGQFPHPSSSSFNPNRNQNLNNGTSFGAGGSNIGGGGIQFTPQNSTLALRSQFYDEAFSRSISLAKGSANNAVKRGKKSVYDERKSHPSSSNNDSNGVVRRLDKVDELGGNLRSSEEDEMNNNKNISERNQRDGKVQDDDGDGDLDLSSYQDAELRNDRKIGIGMDEIEIEENLRKEREELEWENHERNGVVGVALFRNIYGGRGTFR